MALHIGFSMRNAHRVLLGALAAGAVLLGGHFTAEAFAASAAPAWRVTDVATPSVLPQVVGKVGRYDAVVENVGGAPSEGEFKVKITLPTGLAAVDIRSEPSPVEECVSEPTEVTCTLAEPIVPSGFVVMQVVFEVTGPIASLSSIASVSGGGATTTTSDEARMRLGVDGETALSGIADYRFDVTNAAGQPVTQAGGHPFLLTTSLLLNNVFIEGVNENAKPIEPTKDLAFYLPLGMLGNPSVADPCPASLVEIQSEQSGCPVSSRVGTVLPMILSTVFANASDPTHVHGIYSVQPEKGYPAEFAFASNRLTFVMYATVVRHHGSYMLRIAIPGVPQISYLIGFVASFYGDIKERFLVGETEGTFDRGAFLTDPSDCGESEEAREASVVLNTWGRPYTLAQAEKTPGFFSRVPAFSSIEGCDLLGFTARTGVKPETTQADEPSGYEVGLEVPQAPNSFTGLATPPAKDVSLTLPEGTSVSPSSANGLLACQETGPQGINIEGAESEEVGVNGLEQPTAGHCPAASQIATVTASTPLLHEQLTGHMFLAQPKCGGAGQNPCTEESARNGELFRLYLELEGPESGVVIKLAGQASVDPKTGRITASFNEGPQFPFSNLTVSMKHGARAPLENPQSCEVATSDATVMPWSTPTTPDATPQDTFRTDWDGAGGGCPATAPFAPSFTAGTMSTQAATTSPFSLTLKREDREQNVSTISSTLPGGLLADVAKATKCPEPQASQKSLTACPASSQIGTATVAVGPGSDPYYVTGKVFFTGPYRGAPFGLSIVLPATAGPFNLGNELVRVALSVDPHTAQATAVSDPAPQILDGVPLRIRTVNVFLEDRDFVLNPTNCAVKNITGTIRSTTGSSASVSSPFAASGCRGLAFKPQLSGSTEAKATKANGTGVKIKIAYPSAGQANIAKVTLTFPKQLPVRLETLQKACRATVFEANPASCPVESAIGTATVHTPILAQPLSGPAYLVSYGSAKFPDVVFVLQGEGVTLEVDGQSFVSQSGELKVTFASVPDAPFSTFETVLPAGSHSQFTSARTVGRASASQCGESLVTPVTMVAQNGAQITQNAKLAITGCRPAVSIRKAHAAGNRLTLTVNTTARGRLQVGGAGLKTLVKKGVSAGTHTLSVALSPAGRRSVRSHRRINVHVGLTVGKSKASAHKSVAA